MNYTILEYVWIDGINNLRSKTKVYYKKVSSVEDIPYWNYDGSSTHQGTTEDSEVLLIPVRLYNCPFKNTNYNIEAFIVLCETYDKHMNPMPCNHRTTAKLTFDKYKDKEAWYGLEQEYFIYDNYDNKPLGYDENEPKHEKYYCSVGENDNRVRSLSEEHMNMCLYTKIKISGINQEVAPGQCEFQIGPEEGLKVSDDLWVARFILQKLGEKYGVKINFHPKPIQDNCNGSGCHTNFSTKETRQTNGYDNILQYIDKLKDNHKKHIEMYGVDNNMRLTGKNETSSIDKFSWSIGGRDCSIRIGYETFNDKKGYFEDRRPASNMNPYIVCPLILQTCVE